MGSGTNGQRVGRYELVQMLGEGGMGTVWLAHPSEAPEQLYAIKTVSPQFAGDPRVCGMFVKEASLAAAIEHPNVVHLYDVGIHDDVPFFVMEWVDGYSLRDITQRIVETGQRMPPCIALRIASDLCGGLHAAHELCGDDGAHLGLVHRDVSPHNVLITRDGVSKIIDFGVAKARDLLTNNDDSMVGGLKGKVRYMAPEQARERDIDRRADLFSVGAITYELLTGRAPFEGPNELAVINALLSTNPVYVPEDLPEPVQWILRRALARRPDNRFGDAAEMQNAIELALVELGEPDKHNDVAEVLAWYAPDDNETTTRRPTVPTSAPDVAPQLRIPTPSPPPLAFTRPTAQSIPARQPSLLDNDEVALQRRGRAGARSSGLRWVLLAAGVVGLLGIGAAMLVKDPTAQKHLDVGAQPVAGDVVDTSTTTAGSTPVVATTATAAPQPPSPTTPIIDMGDISDQAQPAEKRKRRRPKASVESSRTEPSSAPSMPTERGSTGIDRPDPKPTPAPKPTAKDPNPSDLAGPVKVWK